MESSSITKTIKILNSKEIPLFSLNELGGIFGITNRQTLYKKIQRLESNGILQRLIKGKYLYLLKDVNDFTMANFLYQPSYVSLESAMSIHGIITGIVYQTTSITIKKTNEITVGEKEYSYSHISNKLFWGWEKESDILLATPEKAFLDYLYFVKKGLRSIDWGEIDMSVLDKDLLSSWAKKFKISKAYNLV